MTMTIAARWRVTFRVQPLARVTYPTPATVTKKASRTPDLLAIAEANHLHTEMEAMRQNWRDEAMLTFRRMF